MSTENKFVLDEGALNNLEAASALFWQAFSMADVLASANLNEGDMPTVICALKGVVNLMNEGLEHLAGVK
ncbi:hypothetical protein [Aggregatibacter kilianii]|jgi:hypothetical protein|uniref:hypothetical protein n=1 Tax=Aggregatibacter kilianii TaxID=2025884 RepID=UPI000D646853|nr:hypothetical protein [Aggregatibacter kilianii]DAP21860.1 MAG TPA: hypothetical protein [Caudoviricetes sp.]